MITSIAQIQLHSSAPRCMRPVIRFRAFLVRLGLESPWVLLNGGAFGSTGRFRTCRLQVTEASLFVCCICICAHWLKLPWGEGQSPLGVIWITAKCVSNSCCDRYWWFQRPIRLLSEDERVHQRSIFCRSRSHQQQRWSYPGLFWPEAVFGRYVSWRDIMQLD